jgi:Spy/CpxP family protein refolding chaperone
MKIRIILSIILLTVTLSAREPGNIVKELDLSEDQVVQIKKHMESRQSKRELFNQIKANRDNIREELDKDNPDRAKINNLINEHTSLMKKQLTNMVESTLEMKQILSKQQYQKWRKNMERRRQRPARGERKDDFRKNRN